MTRRIAPVEMSIIERKYTTLKGSPGFSNAYNNRGNVYFLKGQYDLAMVEYKKAIQTLNSGRDLVFQNSIFFVDRGYQFQRQKNTHTQDYFKVGGGGAEVRSRLLERIQALDLIRL